MAERIILKMESEWGWIENRPTYDQIVSTFGTIRAEASSGPYQGDSLYLIEKGGRYGVVTFGWGSCSGCDALEAVESQEELDKLQDDLERGIKWFEWGAEAVEYLFSGGLTNSFLSAQLLLDFAVKVREVVSL